MPPLRSLCFAITMMAACSTTEPDRDPLATFRVLFIGNSLTYANNLPGMVKALADSTGMERTYVEAVAFPNYALEDHWHDGAALEAIRRGGWDYVIMQQGPSSLPESRVNLIEWTGQFATEIRKVGAIPAMYTVWPSAQRFQDFPRVIESYQLAAESVDGVVMAAGAAWLKAWEQDATLQLYGLDAFHPSISGTYLAAITIYGKLYDRATVGLPRGLQIGGDWFELSQGEAAKLQAAADDINGK